MTTEEIITAEEIDFRHLPSSVSAEVPLHPGYCPITGVKEYSNRSLNVKEKDRKRKAYAATKKKRA